MPNKDAIKCDVGMIGYVKLIKSISRQTKIINILEKRQTLWTQKEKDVISNLTPQELYRAICSTICNDNSDLMSKLIKYDNISIVEKVFPFIGRGSVILSVMKQSVLHEKLKLLELFKCSKYKNLFGFVKLYAKRFDKANVILWYHQNKDENEIES